jgi:transcriptional regulator with XRE-family HTH domain
MAKQLAARMGVSPARVSVMERDEQRGAVTLKMMQKAAEALGCEFVYALVPKSARQTSKTTEKPKIRLDSSHLRENPERQVQDLQQEYRRSLRENGKT